MDAQEFTPGLGHLEWISLPGAERSADERFLIEDLGSNWTAERFWLFDTKLCRTLKFQSMAASKAAAAELVTNTYTFVGGSAHG